MFLIASSLSLLALTTTVAEALSSSAWVDPSLLKCDLECANNGYCTLVEGTEEDLHRMSQSGRLVEKCVCQPGFTGVACDQVVEECILPVRKCLNGAPCTQNSDGEWGCDCTSADAMGQFSGFQCRNPVTEYCTGTYDPYAADSFCTHGGRCLSDFLRAQVSIQEKESSIPFTHGGCKCPDAFYGPHCEYLKFPDSMQEPTTTTKKQTDATNPTKSRLMTIIVTMMGLSVVMLGAFVVFKLTLRSSRVPVEITVPPTSPRRVYHDSVYNGRHRSHISSQNTNIRFETVYEDVALT